MTEKLKVLIVEDSGDDLLLVLRALKIGGLDTKHRQVQSQAEFEQALNEASWDVVISDFSLPSFSGLKALEIFQDRQLAIPFIIVSGTIGEETAVQVMRAGANDYVMKDNLQRLAPAVLRELAEFARRREMQAELRKKELQLEKAQKMESIGRLAGGVAHDFNNQLGVITLLCSMIEASLPADHVVQKYVQQILAISDKSADLVKRLLAFSTRHPVETKTVDLNVLLGESQKLLTKLIGDDIQIEVKTAEPALVNINPNLFEQVLMNLALNARDAMPQGGRITFESQVVASQVVLKVRDTGTGMSPEVQAKIFEPFFTTKGIGKGTGLGLSMAYATVKQSQGEITVESEAGKGTAFTILLPLAVSSASPQTVKTSKSPAAPVVPTGSETILVVEDEAPLQEVIVQLLTLHGYKVLTAGDGVQALKVINEDLARVDLVLTDMNMPNMGGWELVKKILLVQPEIKVIFTSGYSDQIENLGSVTMKNTDFLPKPASKIQLLNKVRAVLDGVS